MITIKYQMEIGKYTIVSFDSERPKFNYSKVIIDDKEYIPEIVYDLNNSIAIPAHGTFIGKEIKFV